ncbi:MAG: HlyD family efflux transporter periplasmic adaptor subunit [Flavobacteriales bacterium]|nr:HlyD family efflux transporter periplasmic adaptor subunit [Flavobacteriales bacterium]
MLNISKHSISDKVIPKNFSVLRRVEAKRTSKVFLKILIIGFSILFFGSFLPWTQNVRSYGNVTTLKPEQRPQTIHSIIAGRVDRWLVQEGDFVKSGDTIAIISEIKDDYFDENLLDRTENQLNLKKQSAITYGMKEKAQETQLSLLNTQRGLKLKQARVKLKQARLKVQNDSIEYISAQLNYETAIRQFNRMDSLYKLGLKSLVDLETRRINKLKTNALIVEAENNWISSKNEVDNLILEIMNIQTKYENDIAKTLSDKLTTSTNKYDAESGINKLENQFKNYEVRSGYHYIIAPQDGYITQTYVTGIGETIKEGQEIASIMPMNYDLAVEIYIEPIDLPLMHIGEHVRVQFDGWPAIVFSGWPNTSYGTYGGQIYAIDQFISKNGKFRLLVKPDPNDHPWPKALRYGGGTKSLILLNNVPLWYELWRKINGFPPNFYQPNGK